ncbi:MAG: response regulator transcription factor [Actinomycetota bacterium]|nr:response regulator transcription factor [Actinomycetota bacterium]
MLVSVPSRNLAGTARLVRPDGAAPRVLVVDDEAGITDALVSALRFEGFDAQGALDGSTALVLAARQQPDLVILDVMLPDLDGLEVLHRLRIASEHVCVLFLTARDTVEDRITGISAGADDYVTKPFSLQEVLARSRGLLRRAGLAQAKIGSRIKVGDLVLDEDAHEAFRSGERIELTATEFALLSYLAHNARRVMSKPQILDQVWSYDFGGHAHVVELYISYLRKKLDAGRPAMIHTVRGVGYVLKPAAPS